MVSLTLSISPQLRQRMNKHREVVWSDVVRSIIERQLNDLEQADMIANKSRLTPADVSELSEAIDSDMVKRLKEIK